MKCQWEFFRSGWVEELCVTGELKCRSFWTWQYTSDAASTKLITIISVLGWLSELRLEAACICRNQSIRLSVYVMGTKLLHANTLALVSFHHHLRIRSSMLRCRGYVEQGKEVYEYTWMIIMMTLMMTLNNGTNFKTRNLRVSFNVLEIWQFF